MYCISRYLYQCYSKNLFGVVSIAQSVEVTDNAVLGSVVEVVSSTQWVINLFQHLLSFSIFIYSNTDIKFTGIHHAFKNIFCCIFLRFVTALPEFIYVSFFFKVILLCHVGNTK